MKITTISLIVALLIVEATCKPTFDVIADIMHDLIHDPNLPENHGRPPQYVHNGAYAHIGYDRPGYTHGEYGYHQRPYHNAPNGYYPNNHHGGYYPPTGAGHYGPNSVYDTQGYYRGPPYANNANPQPNGYNYGYNKY